MTTPPLQSRAHTSTHPVLRQHTRRTHNDHTHNRPHCPRPHRRTTGNHKGRAGHKPRRCHRYPKHYSRPRHWHCRRNFACPPPMLGLDPRRTQCTPHTYTRHRRAQPTPPPSTVHTSERPPPPPLGRAPHAARCTESTPHTRPAHRPSPPARCCANEPRATPTPTCPRATPAALAPFRLRPASWASRAALLRASRGEDLALHRRTHIKLPRRHKHHLVDQPDLSREDLPVLLV